MKVAIVEDSSTYYIIDTSNPSTPDSTTIQNYLNENSPSDPSMVKWYTVDYVEWLWNVEDVYDLTHRITTYAYLPYYHH